jgi:hypothetical protein
METMKPTTEQTEQQQTEQERINLALYNFHSKNFAEINQLIIKTAHALEAEGVKGKVILELWDIYDRILELRRKE